jgi:predicted ATPase
MFGVNGTIFPCTTPPRSLYASSHDLGFFAAYGRQALECLASDLIELSTIQNFAHWLAVGVIYRGWAHSALGHTTEGITQIEDGIEDYRGTGSMIDLPYLLALKAEALHLANRTVEALEAIREADTLVEKSEARWWCAELCRLRGVFLAGYGC